MIIRIEKSWFFFGKPRVIYTCPHCESELKSVIEDIGKEDFCPRCDGSFTVPGDQEYYAYINKNKQNKESLQKLQPTSVNQNLINETNSLTNNENSDNPKCYYIQINPYIREINFENEVNKRIVYYNQFQYYAPILNRKPDVILGVPNGICPYCENKCKKGQCLNCGKLHQSRTSLENYNIWLNIRDEWIQPIDEQRAIHDGWHLNYLSKLRLREAIKDVLTASGLINYTEENAEYIALEREKSVYSYRKQWGLYTSAIAEQGNALAKQGKTFEALIKYIENVYLDLNGPVDAGICNENSEFQQCLLQKHKSWDKTFSSASLASVVIDLSWDLKLNKSELKELFLMVAEETQIKFNTPMKPLTAFNKMWKEAKE